MKSNLEEFLKDLSDHELAIFIAYRYKHFLTDSRRKIKNEITSRKLDNDILLKLFQKGLKIVDKVDHLHCPRCNSNRIFIEQDHEEKTRKYYSYEVILETNRCQLCGYNPSKRKPKNIFDAIKMKLGNSGNQRLAEPNEKIFKHLE